MKQDPYFKYLAVIILAGVIVALVNPTPAAAPALKPPALAATTTHAPKTRS